MFLPSWCSLNFTGLCVYEQQFTLKITVQNKSPGSKQVYLIK